MSRCLLMPNNKRSCSKNAVGQEHVTSEVQDGGKIDGLSKLGCSKLVISLNHAVAVYGQLCLALGGTSDTDELRHELQKQREKACNISMKTKEYLIPLYKNKISTNPNNCPTEEKCDLERLGFLFSGCLELLKGELIKSLSLHRLFLTSTESPSFINTGISDYGLGSAPCVSIANISNSNEKVKVEKENIASIEKDITCIVSLENDVDRIISIQPWTVEPEVTTDHFACDETSSNESVSVEIQMSRSTDRNRARYIWMAIFIVAVITITGSVVGLAIGLT